QDSDDDRKVDLPAEPAVVLVGDGEPSRWHAARRWGLARRLATGGQHRVGTRRRLVWSRAGVVARALLSPREFPGRHRRGAVLGELAADRVQGLLVVAQYPVEWIEQPLRARLSRHQLRDRVGPDCGE